MNRAEADRKVSNPFIGFVQLDVRRTKAQKLLKETEFKGLIRKLNPAHIFHVRHQQIKHPWLSIDINPAFGFFSFFFFTMTCLRGPIHAAFTQTYMKRSHCQLFNWVSMSDDLHDAKTKTAKIMAHKIRFNK